MVEFEGVAAVVWKGEEEGEGGGREGKGEGERGVKVMSIELLHRGNVT